VEAAYRAASAGRVVLPPVGHIALGEEGADCHIKYGHVVGDPFFVVKIATGFPGNAAFGLPTGNGLSLVLSTRTGAVEAVLHDEMAMTDIRTGLGGAVASRLLARPDSRRILIVGTGVQARRQVEAHATLFGRDVAVALWGRSDGAAHDAVTDQSAIADISVAGNLETACRAADIIVTATGASAPLVMADWVRPGTHVTAVGADAPGKQELDIALVARADGLFCDHRGQCLDHGELSHAARAGLLNGRAITEIGEALAEPERGRIADAHVTVADLTGIAAQDIAIAGVVLDAHRAE